jgi:sensor histidine kinase regulating citrate/malate metabolism
LLYEAKKEELAFINSHEVRKHLTNILGIIDILQHSENKLDDYKQIEEYLLQSAAKLDESIKSISEKLND